LIKWLQERCLLPIHLARHGEKALAGHVYLAPDGVHMEVTKNNVIFLNALHHQVPQPAVGHLFRSMAHAYGSHCVGVILTGMGRDGAQDLLLMKQKGAYTIAQDEKSCVVFGMPQEAIKLGAVTQVLPLDKIASALIYLVNQQIKAPS
jgi:two-component system chemotaxis response regulator CheB